jgi:dipeptidyl aminopeptidase/acylaminoacyl peptidase
MNLWVAPVGEFNKARAITRDKGRGIPSHFWALDSRHVLYIQDKNGDENWHLYSVNLSTDETIDLSPYDGVQAQMVEQSAEKPGIAIVGMNDRDARWHDLYSVELATAKRTLLQKNDSYGAILVDNDLAVRLAIQQTPSGSNKIFERKNDSWVELFEIPMEDALTSDIIGFDTENKGIYMLDSRGQDKASLTHINLVSGASEVLAESDVADITDVIMDPRTHTPIAYAINIHTRNWVALDTDFSEDIAALNNALQGDSQILAITLDAERWIVYVDNGSESPVYAVYDRKTKSLDAMFVTNPKLKGLALAKMHNRIIKSRDGMDLVSYLTLPVDSDPDGDGKPSTEVPMVLLVHGGPWGRDAYGYSGQVQWLANRGYAVLQVNFRASTGFGKGFVNAGNKEWAAAMHNDLLDAVEWAITEGITSRNQVAIMGGSYGGYATLVGMTFTPEFFQCGVDIVGPSNLNTLLSSIPPYWEGFKQTFVVAIGDPETEAGQALLASRSPINFVDQIKRPLLIGQGANDPRVNQAESDQIVAAMDKKGIPVTYVLYPDEGHGFQKPENNLSFYAVTEAFLAECVGGRYQPIEDDFEGSSIQIVQGAEFVPGLKTAIAK